MGGALAFVAMMFFGIGAVVGWIGRDLSFKAEVVDEAIKRAADEKGKQG